MKKILLLLLILLFNGLSFQIAAQSYPAGFSQVLVTNGIDNPSVFAFAPDGRIFIAQQNGVLKVYKNGALLPTPALTVDIIDLPELQESGLVGISVHPDFSVNNYVYLYYTKETTPGKARNRVSRFTFSGDVIDPASEVLILELDEVDGKIHNGGFMKFSQDGKLFVSVGESNKSALSQSLDSYLGKLLRINPDGSAPADNPYASGTSDQSKRIWAMGFRNPFTFDIDPESGKIFVNDVGHATWEEINNATEEGLNFGWPLNEGHVENTTYTNPLFSYKHSDYTLTGCAVSGGTFFRPVSTNYPSEYTGKYFFMDYCSNFIRIIDPAQTPAASSSFASSIPSNSLSLKTGPDGNLYFLNRQNGSLYKIIYSLNQSPAVTEQPENARIGISQNASFYVAVSGVPPFTYQWKKNNAVISGATDHELEIADAQLSDAGTYSVVITNSFGSIESAGALLTVVNTKPPVATILSPGDGAFYKAGETIHFSGSATDEEDGELPASAFSWSMEFWHGTGTHQHVHDSPSFAVGVKSGTYTIPTNNETATDVFYRLRLEVKDSDNISNSASADLLPVKATISLATNPSGLKILLDNKPRSTPLSFESVAGIERTLGVVTYQNKNGTTYKFHHWSNNGAGSHVIHAPQVNKTYTAVFYEDTELREPENPDNTAAGLNYNYYEGAWLVLPDFSQLTADETGVISSFDISPKNRDEEYGFVFTGFIDILSDGVYKFYSNSNDGSRLYIGNRLIVDNDGQHPAVENAGTIGLKAGKHAIAVHYFQYNGSASLDVSYSAAGLSKQEIPASRLFHATASTSNIAPSVSISQPSYDQQISTPDITIVADVWDADGSITKVEFYEGSNKLGEDNSAPFEFTWNSVSDGDYVVTVRAFDNNGVSSSSAAVPVKVGIVSAVRQKESALNVKLYPNPVEEGSITLDIKGYEGKGKGIVRIVNLEGKEMYSEKIVCKPSSDQIIINADKRLAKGNYMIYIEIDQKVYSEMILIK